MRQILIIAFLFQCLTGYCDKYVWNSKAPLPAMARHRAVALSIGNKGYMGFGRNHSYGGSLVWINYFDWWEYDPATNSWTQKADCPMGFNTGATFSIGNKGYVGTGDGEIMATGSKFGESNYFFQYDPLLNAWTQKANFPYLHCEGVGFAINGKGYIGAGRNYAAANCPLCEYNPVTDTWTPLAYTGVIQSTRMPTAFVANNKAYILESGIDTYSSVFSTFKFWEFNPATSSIVQKANFIGNTPVCCTAFSVKGLGYVGLGGARDFYYYNPVTDVWDTLQKKFPGVHRNYAPSFVVGDNAYFGTGSNGTNLADLWCFEWKISVGIDEYLKENTISIFPNPTTDALTINIDKEQLNSKLIVTLYTLEGKEALSQNIIDTQTKISVNHLSKGIYFATISSANSSILNTQKIIIN